MTILGLGGYLPEKILTNDDLAKMVDTNDEWIAARTGIRARHIAAAEETTLDMAEKAARQALERAGNPDISLVIVTTVTGETITPTVASLLTGRLGIDCPAFDLNAACTGFLYGLKAVGGMIAPGENALIVGAEKLSRLVDWEDRATCVLFGDGAGAMVVGEGGHEILNIELFGKADMKSALTIEGVNYMQDGSISPSKISMNGPEVYKFATRTIVKDVRVSLEKTGLAVDDIDYFVAHQANARIILSGAEKLGLPEEKIFLNIDHTANTSSATIPIALTELEDTGMLRGGDIIALAAFGGGFTSAAGLIRW